MKFLARVRIAFVLLAGVIVAACETELYSSLPEGQANEMVALLIANGIDATKGTASKGLVPLSVPTSDMSRAIDILRSNGYPRDTFEDLGTVFEQKGLVSSPLEERVRYIYGLSQTLSETLSQIDGVVSARVHIVLAEGDTLTDKSGKSSASVFLKTRPSVDLSNKIPDIKQLVQAGIEDLAYDDVVVSLFESDPIAAAVSDQADAIAASDAEKQKTATNHYPLILGGLTFLVLVGAGGGFFFLRRGKDGASGPLTLIKPKTQNEEGKQETVQAVESNE